MKILMLTQIVPFPPDSGPKVKTYSTLRYLAQRHDVHLLSFARSSAEEDAARQLRSLCASATTIPIKRSSIRDALYLAKSVMSGRPFLIERDDVLAMRAAVKTLARTLDVDAVHADQLSMAQFAVDVPVKLRVLDEHNAVWTIVRRAAGQERSLVRRPLAEIEWRKLKAYEGEVCRRFDRVTTVSREDLEDLEEAARGVFNASIIPIAVATDELPVIPRSEEARDIVSVATMFYPPNAEGISWFATEILPLIRQRIPDVRLRVVGSRPPTSITGLASDASGIDVMGYIPDLEPVLRRAGVVIVPLRAGSGMRVKILEAFARGIPVVSTPIGVEGIDAKAPDHLLVGETAEDFAGAVVRVLTEPAEAARLGAAGRALVEARYDWRSALVGLDEVYMRGEALDAGPRLAAQAARSRSVLEEN